jgi:hypothetical protein
MPHRKDGQGLRIFDLKQELMGVSINSNFPAQPIRRAPLPELATRALLDSLCPPYS